MTCWICGKSEALSREHTFKASDVRQYFGNISPSRPLFKHDDKRINKRLNSAKSKKLTSKSLICENCNNKLTQPYDYAWGKLSKYLHENWHSIARQGRFSLSKVFPGQTKSGALDVHLFFVKIFGCLILEGNIPIDINSFSEALLKRNHHDEVYLTIAITPLDKKMKIASISDIHALNANGHSDAVAWMYTFSPISVRVSFFSKKSNLKLWPNSWHPKNSGKCIKLGNYLI